MFTVLPVPMVLFVKEPVTLLVFSVTSSPPTTPTNAALPVFKVAFVPPS